MRRALAVAVTGALGVLLTVTVVNVPASAAVAPQTSHRVCAAAPVGFAACDSWVHARTSAQPAATTPTGYGPADLQSAYNLAAASASNGAGVTIGIVDAFDDPTAFGDVNTYRAQFGIPALASCTPTTIRSSTTPCFAKSNQTGGTTPPRKNGSWAQEESLDVDMASAICPHCNILLVEADTNSLANLGASVNEAVTLGAAVVSNSYGGGEASAEVTEESQFYNHPGVAITASSGDGGFGVEFPAASQFVTAVGGTSLVRANNARGWSETVWSGAGSGCSAFVTKPAWQTDAGCARRTVADVSAVADPNTGVAVFDSTLFQGLSGWLEFGGTSVSSPIIASVYALAGNASTVTYGSFPYSHTASLNDVTSGSNGDCGNYLCTGGAGYDGPTGLGTPNGTGAF
ncbi:MAG TPA: S53 family peptidase [Pseudonocardiaceae bacterium]|nr:S53 family peptidase [Pseudonocardiaceae bacterium]